MSKYRSTIFFKDSVTGFLLIYLFYVLANLFFIPNYSDVNSLQPHAGVTRQTISVDHGHVGYVRLGEKSIIDEDQLNNNKSFPVYFQLAFDHFRIFRSKTLPLFASKTIFHIFQHSYLSLCILRI